MRQQVSFKPTFGATFQSDAAQLKALDLFQVAVIAYMAIAVHLWGWHMRWIDRVERRVKLRDLHILNALAECGSMARAARQLGVSQPVVSKAVADLEHVLGVRLLDRTAKGVEPTVYGRALLDCGTAVFDDLRRGLEEIAFLSDPTVGELRVGGAGPFVDGLLPAAISQFTDRYPRVAFQVIGSDPPILCRMLRDRQLDLAILRTSSSTDRADLDAVPLFDEPLLVIAGLDHPLSSRRKVEVQAILGGPWTLPGSYNIAGALIEDGFRAAGVTPPVPQVVSDSTAFRTRLVEMGRFLSFLPGSTLHFGGASLRVKVLPVDLDVEAPPLELFTLNTRTPNAISRLFITELQKVAMPFAKGRRSDRRATTQCNDRQRSGALPTRAEPHSVSRG